MKENFDYESKIWGFKEVRLNPTNPGALSLKNCLEDLREIRGRVLDVGCGGGAFTRAIKYYRPGLEVYGCDVSQKAIQLALKNPGGAHFSVADAANLPFPDASFDVVLLKCVLEHVPRPQKALCEGYRVLKKGGFLHSITPLEGSLFTLHGLLGRIPRRSIEKYEGHLYHYDKNSLIKLHERAGLEVKRYRFSGFFLYQLIDVLYYPLLDLLRAPVSFSVAGYLGEAKPTALTRVLSFLRSLIALVNYFESTVLKKFPGFFIHISCFKE